MKYVVFVKEKLPNFPTPSVIAEPPSDFLIIQCHGGGFVSQTSKTHEVSCLDLIIRFFICD